MGSMNNNEFLPRRGQRHRLRPRPGQSGQSSSTQNSAQNGEQPSAFHTPDEVATQDEHQQGTADNSSGAVVSHHSPNIADQPSPKPKKGFKAWLKGLSKKQWALIIIITAVLLGAIGFGIYNLFIKDDAAKPAPVAKKQEVPPPPAEPTVSKLTGLPISDASINQRPVTAVMIENSPDARPQSALNQAGVVFEAVAEGGITRFLTLFQDTEPEYIGPVRSVRPYYVLWATGFDAAIAHVGGSGDALKMLRQDHVTKDLDQFFNPGPYHRVSNRFAPHNMYSSVKALRELQNQKGYTSDYQGFARKPEAKSATPNANSIDFNISGAVYNPHYDYDAATNSYKRSEGGAPHIDEKSGQQLSPKVVVGLVMAQGKNGIYTTYGATGSGQAYVFQDGTVTMGTWHKPDAKSNFTFTDANGAELKLNPGQTWLSVVGGSDRVTYK
jgi:hypothetical protein